MKTKKLLLSLILITSVLFYFSCRKTDITSSTETVSKNLIEEKFFTSNRTADPTEDALINFLRRVNDKENFVEKTATLIGYPRWDKIFTKQKKYFTPSFQTTLTGDSSNTYYIPFVRDSQNFVNAAMMIRTSPTDTTLSYACDWEYKRIQNSVSSISDSAEHFAVFFMKLNNMVFGYDKFKIIDSHLFRKNSGGTIHVRLNNTVDSNVNNFNTVFTCQNVVISWQDCLWSRKMRW